MTWKRIFFSHKHETDDLFSLLDHSHPDPHDPTISLYTYTPEWEDAALSTINEHVDNGNLGFAQKLLKLHEKIKNDGLWTTAEPWEGMFEDTGGPAREQLTTDTPKPTPPKTTPPQTFGYL